MKTKIIKEVDVLTIEEATKKLYGYVMSSLKTVYSESGEELVEIIGMPGDETVSGVIAVYVSMNEVHERMK